MLTSRTENQDHLASMTPKQTSMPIRERASFLADRALTAEGRVAHSEDRRPGTWFGDTDADGRVLTQAETDTLIRAELVSMAPVAERDEVMRLIGEPRSLELVLEEIVDAPPRSLERYRTRKRRARATVQRGGIDSDPLVRLLAYRAWGDRDRRWYEERGVRKGEPVAYVPSTHELEQDLDLGNLVVARAWSASEKTGVALADGRPGETIWARFDVGRLAKYAAGLVMEGEADSLCRVDDRPRLPPSSSLAERIARRGRARARFRADIAAAERRLCKAFGFHDLRIEGDRVQHMTTFRAERFGVDAQVQVGDSELGAARDRGVGMDQVCAMLDRALQQQGVFHVLTVRAGETLVLERDTCARILVSEGSGAVRRNGFWFSYDELRGSRKAGVVISSGPRPASAVDRVAEERPSRKPPATPRPRKPRPARGRPPTR